MNTDVQWILGLPFDLTGARHAADGLREAGVRERSVVFATPNLNFLRSSSESRKFRDDILRTDLSLVDGMPIVWLGRALGVPVRERVAGSTLVDLLAEPHKNRQPLRTFIFGAEGESAQLAMNAVNTQACGLVGVGALNPGFGSVKELSSASIIDTINASNPELLIVSLGAVKGHAWIEHNRDQLQVPLISHLGAAVNFLAGTVRRAPPFMQKTGLEWLWRVFSEPRLTRRYAGDALYLARELITAVLPLMWMRLWRGRRAREIAVDEVPGRPGLLLVSGALTADTVSTLVESVERLRSAGADAISLNFSDLTYVDCRGLGYLYELVYRRIGPATVQLGGRNRTLDRLLRLHRAECLFDQPVTSVQPKPRRVAPAATAAPGRNLAKDRGSFKAGAGAGAVAGTERRGVDLTRPH